MNFPFNKVRKILRDTESKFECINLGGCGVAAYILARQLQKVSEPKIIVSGYGKHDIDVARLKVSENTTHQWNAQNIHFNHVWVEFKINHLWYGIDSSGLQTRAKMHKEHGTPYKGSLTLTEMRKLVSTRTGWNSSFDRQQIAPMKRFLNRKLNNLFGT